MILVRSLVVRIASIGTSLFLLAAAPPPVDAIRSPSFADLSTLALAAPVVLRATITKAERLGQRDAAGVAPGLARMLVTASTSAVTAAPNKIPPRITYLTDVSLDGRGKLPKFVGRDLLLFLRPGAVSGQYALVSSHAELPWSSATDASVRAILKAERSGTTPTIIGVTSVFRVPGAVPGEAESQFFLGTADGKPVSLVVLTRPGEPRRLTIALGDVIDDAAPPIAKDTLLWYRLACFLPPELPALLGAGAEVADDYSFIHADLGPCGRTF